jgi:hypothetical protein
MKIFTPFLVAALATQSWAAPTLYLAGDSTMASGGGGSGTEGLYSRFSLLTLDDKFLTGLKYQVLGCICKIAFLASPL